MSSTLKQKLSQSLIMHQNLHNKSCNANTLEELRDIFERASAKIFKGKHSIEYYPASIVSSTTKRQMVLRVDDISVSLEKQLFTPSGCKSFITRGQSEVIAKLEALLNKE